jgi:two-component system, chemotaxis family, sensor kinase CheA
MSDYLDPNNEELLKDFFIEANLQVDTLEQNILVLENDPGNRDAVDEIFRAAHTLKGGAATVQMTELAEFTHLVEDVLDGIRSDEVGVDTGVVDTLLESIDIIKEMLASRADGKVYNEPVDDLKAHLKLLISGGAPAAAQKTTPTVTPKAKKQPDRAPTDKDQGETLSEYELLELQEAAEDQETIYEVLVRFNPDHPMNTVGGVQIFAGLKSVGTVLKTIPDFEELYEDQFYPEVRYYIASEEQAEAIRKKTEVSDVVVDSEVRTAGELFSGQGSRETSSPLPESAPPPDKAAPVKPEKKEAPAAGPEVQEELTEDEEAVPEVKREQEIRKQSSGSVLRVDSRRIDNLLNLVSETVITKATFNQISAQFGDAQLSLANIEKQYRESLKDLFDSLPEYLEQIQNGTPVKQVKADLFERFGHLFTLLDPLELMLKSSIAKFRSTSQNLSRTTSELQEGVMQIRMVPVSQIFNRFPRLVRDVSRDLSKKVKLEIEGEDTELDKSVIEDLLDPLIHCVRNSVDHGIETPEVREAEGKPREGLVKLKASNEGNMIIIEIIDDGKGIDVDSVRKRAIDRGLIHPNKKLSDIEAFNLIFEPGFSTAKVVTNISGRGVGLDVVRKQIEKLNGNVTVWSEKDLGSKITIKIPLTLAIIQGLLIRVGKEIYAIPITSVVDSHRIKPKEIRMIDNYEVFNVRDDVVSLIRLSRLFGIPAEEERDHHFVVIVGTGDKKMGLVVDSLIGEEDVVIKPLRDKYTNAPGIAGATILGDGTVALIIDVSQLLDLGMRQELENRRRRSATIG